jgi:hypothetical protein
MSFKSPLRTQWDRDKKQFEAMALGVGDRAVIARALVAFMPSLISFMEGELQRGTRPNMTLEATTAAISNMAFQAIAATVEMSDRRAALHILHQILERDVGGRLDRTATGQILLPGSLQ